MEIIIKRSDTCLATIRIIFIINDKRACDAEKHIFACLTEISPDLGADQNLWAAVELLRCMHPCNLCMVSELMTVVPYISILLPIRDT